nr:immunoglobulin heavy chain junction region [Mus musculus]
CAREWGAMDYW